MSTYFRFGFSFTAGTAVSELLESMAMFSLTVPTVLISKYCSCTTEAVVARRSGHTVDTLPVEGKTMLVFKRPLGWSQSVVSDLAVVVVDVL